MKREVVLHLGVRYFPHKGGSTRRLDKLISCMHNIAAVVITDMPCSANTGQDDEQYSAYEVVRVDGYFSYSGIAKIKAAVRKYCPKAVVLHNPRVLLLWSLFIDPCRKITRVVEYHGFDNFSGRWGRWIPRIARLGDRHVVLSEKSRNFLRQRTKIRDEDITVIPNGVSEIGPEVEGRMSSDKKTIGYIGSYHHWQGTDFFVHTAIKGYPRLKDRCRFVMCGGGSIGGEIERAISSAGLDKAYLHNYGWVGKSEADALLRSIDVVVVPRRSTLGTETVVPLKVVEALCHGKVIIATDVGGHTELLKDRVNALIVPPENPVALIECIEAVLDSDVLYTDLVRGALATAQRLKNWDECAALYETVLAGGNIRLAC